MKLILSMFVAAVLLSDVEAGRSLVFPEETANSFVELFPAKELSLNAFTLCLRFATELKGKREVILFAYRTRDFDELNVWREKDGPGLWFHTAKEPAPVPELGPLANHVCLTWESLTGRTTMYVNGRSSASQIFQRGHRVRPGGKIILGQDPDNFLGDFQAEQSFVGEIFGVNMWDYVLPSVAIQLLSTGEDFSDANVLDWATVTLMPTGSAVEYK
uniref:Pentraxin family member n=1 Tax=Gadus morhua TaxID=8049 RepID=A0A8C5AGG6_GADMO